MANNRLSIICKTCRENDDVPEGESDEFLFAKHLGDWHISAGTCATGKYVSFDDVSFEDALTQWLATHDHGDETNHFALEDEYASPAVPESGPSSPAAV